MVVVVMNISIVTPDFLEVRVSFKGEVFFLANVNSCVDILVQFVDHDSSQHCEGQKQEHFFACVCSEDSFIEGSELAHRGCASHHSQVFAIIDFAGHLSESMIYYFL